MCIKADTNTRTSCLFWYKGADHTGDLPDRFPNVIAKFKAVHDNRNQGGPQRCDQAGAKMPVLGGHTIRQPAGVHLDAPVALAQAQ